MDGIKYCPACFYDEILDDFDFYHPDHDDVMVKLHDHIIDSAPVEYTLFIEFIAQQYSYPTSALFKIDAARKDWFRVDYFLTKNLICCGSNFLVRGALKENIVEDVFKNYERFEDNGGFDNPGNIFNIADLYWFAARNEKFELADEISRRVARNSKLFDWVIYHYMARYNNLELKESVSFKELYTEKCFRARRVCERVFIEAGESFDICRGRHEKVMRRLLHEDRAIAKLYPYIYYTGELRDMPYEKSERQRVFQLGFICPRCQFGEVRGALDNLSSAEKVNVLDELV